MHTRFFPLSSRDEVVARKAKIAQEFHLLCDEMPVQDFMYLSDKVDDIWASKKKCIETKTIYIGG